MDVAIPFKLNYKLNDEIQEFNLKFDPNENSFDTLIEFIQKFSDKIVNIEYRNGIDVKTAAALAKVGDNVRFRLKAEDIQKSDRLFSRGCKFFFDSSMAAGSWMELYQMVNQHCVCSVYICDDLVYELDKVSAFCHEHDVKVRMVLNRAPLTQPVKQDMWIAPMYRPQDIPVLEKYGVDVVEFDCGSPYDFKQLAVLYKVYIKDKDWYGQLGEINPDFKDRDIPCRGFPVMLADKRSICGLRCLRGGHCRTCRNLVTVAQDLRDIGAQLTV